MPTRERLGRLTSAKGIALALALVIAATAAAAVTLSGGGGVPLVPPAPPGDLHSTSHRVGVASTQAVIAMAWRSPPGVTGYSIAFTRSAATIPPPRADLPASATAAHSLRLAPGRWWFHVRARGRDGRWTRVVHTGPYVIVAPHHAHKAPTPAPTISTTAAAPPQPLTKRTTKRRASTTPRRQHRVPARRRSSPPPARTTPPATTTPPPTTPTTTQPTTTPPPTTTTTQPPPTGTQGGTPAQPG